MIFRQLLEPATGTYTYILGNRSGGEALIIDPVIDRVERYLQLLGELDLRLVKALDTHVHADHITGLGALRDRTRCVTVMGGQSAVDTVSMRVRDGDLIDIEGLTLEALYTPGHTDDSYCFRMADRVFTGDTLLIRGTGRTDFQHGDSAAAWRSIVGKLLTLPDDTLVYPGHDYKGETVSTIGEERRFNPRLQVAGAREYAAIMDGLNLPNPRQMDVAVPANVKIGLSQTDLGDPSWAVSVARARAAIDAGEVVLVDLREDSERARDGVIAGSLHVPYVGLEAQLGGSGLTGGRDAPILYYCAYGERSTLAVRLSKEHGFAGAAHIVGGIDAWKKAGEPIESQAGTAPDIRPAPGR